MVNIEGLLEKVANNGATLYGILAHGEWNTLVQAVRELQQIAASDERLSNMNSKITELVNKITTIASKVDANESKIGSLLTRLVTEENLNNEQDESIASLQNDDLQHHTIRFGGLVRNVNLMSVGLTGITYTWGNVFYDTYRNIFVLKYGNNYYNSWNTMTKWASYSGEPYPEKIYSTGDKLYKVNTDTGKLVEVGDTRLVEIESEVADLLDACESLLSAIDTHDTSIREIENENNRYNTVHFDGFLTESVRIEPYGLVEPTGVYPIGKVLYYEWLKCFVYLFQSRYYNSWWDVNKWNDVSTQHPYENKMYVNDGHIYMYNTSTSKLEQTGANIVVLTTDEYALLESAGQVDSNLFYGTYEDE